MTPRVPGFPATALATACAAVLLSAAASAGSAPSSRPPGPEGCYDVQVGLWRALTDRTVSVPRLPPDQTRDSTAYVLPPRVLLSTRPVDLPGGEWRSAAAPEGALPTGHRAQAWRASAEGGLLLWFAAAGSGLQGSLVGADSGFRGLLRTFDATEGAQLYERDLSLTLVDCASAPPASSDALRRLPRAVDLAGGARLRLGETPPDGLDAGTRPSGAVGVRARTVGLFAGSDSIAYRVGANDGRVGVVQVIFPAPAIGDTLIERITREFGPPDPNTAVPGAWWHNRVTEVSVITSPDGGYRLLLQDPRSW